MVKKKAKTSEILGVDKNFLFDGFMGIVIGLVIVLLGKISPAISTIGIPSNLAINLDVVGRFLIIVIIASITESLFFFQFILSFFDDKLENFGIKIPFFVAAIITAIIFSLFHILAYGSSLSAAGGSFFSAFLMGLIFAYEVKIFKSVLPAILTHMVLNLSIMLALAIII